MNGKSFNELTFTDLVEILKGVDKKTWIKVAIVAAITIVLFIFIIWPAWFSRAVVKQKIQAFAGQVATLNTLQIREPELLRLKEDYLKFIYSAKERLFKQGESNLLLGQISKMADESGVTILSSSPRNFTGTFPAPFNSQYEASQYDFRVEGQYHEIGRFISKIESNMKLLRILSFQITPGKKETPDRHIVNFSLSAVSTMNVGGA